MKDYQMSYTIIASNTTEPCYKEKSRELSIRLNEVNEEYQLLKDRYERLYKFIYENKISVPYDVLK